MMIRTLRKNEVNKVSGIVRANYSKTFEKRARKEMNAMFAKEVIRPHFIVAEDKNRMVGFAGYVQSWEDYSVYELLWVNVLPEQQHKGIGTALVREAIRHIRKRRGIDKAHLVSITTTFPKFYKKLGFKIVKSLEKKYKLMVRKL
ncbi:MAG: GNAT family N-acetyltransferase [Candidatus Nanoarchaeia archaeon]|nr:GNAT family N-acetyltransferase [Candidatus Nanoarchaeia archaeon]MDD5239636.1 GNAT family N-acetyltransferase [Candidatus Nanoarchaeia archaeon]